MFRPLHHHTSDSNLDMAVTVEFGRYELSVGEVVQDLGRTYSIKTETDPVGTTGFLASRGGFWFNVAVGVRVSYREQAGQDGSQYGGFRVVPEPGDASAVAPGLSEIGLSAAVSPSGGKVNVSVTLTAPAPSGGSLIAMGAATAVPRQSRGSLSSARG